MDGSSRLSRAKETGTRRRLVISVALAFATAVAAASAGQAQTVAPPPTPTPTSVNSDLSAGAAVTNLGSNFLERLGNQATNGFGRALRDNPAGGGASEATDPPRFRTWGRPTESRPGPARSAILLAIGVRPGAA